LVATLVAFAIAGGLAWFAVTRLRAKS